MLASAFTLVCAAHAASASFGYVDCMWMWGATQCCAAKYQSCITRAKKCAEKALNTFDKPAAYVDVTYVELYE